MPSNFWINTTCGTWGMLICPSHNHCTQTPRSGGISLLRAILRLYRLFRIYHIFFSSYQFTPFYFPLRSFHALLSALSRFQPRPLPVSPVMVSSISAVWMVSPPPNGSELSVDLLFLYLLIVSPFTYILS